MPNSTTIRSGVDGRLAAVERDQAVTNTRLNTLTDNVQTLADHVKMGFDKIESLLSDNATTKASSGRFTPAQITTAATTVLVISTAAISVGLYVMRAEIGDAKQALKLESTIREAHDRLADERLRNVGVLPNQVFDFPTYQPIGAMP